MANRPRLSVADSGYGFAPLAPLASNPSLGGNKTLKRCRGATRGEFNYGSNAPLRSWGGSAVLGRQRRPAGVSPMSNCRGFPHERLNQDKSPERGIARSGDLGGSHKTR
ncbi:hypothetical protein BJP34_34820 [Moorena producens PAL-8-15-08-1]|uniref:Uncharacterized protein n=1 Tax=Moorena producens PAL-8-15-08-1 TaxID=1458985 RepID=A0A1D8U211_9CYAN|nr:hypothetical protein [Moorena producens]AOX03918.1 hypothetical protein BJP34_34820 [Moorena producens PAL-8-15-08-1]